MTSNIGDIDIFIVEDDDDAAVAEQKQGIARSLNFVCERQDELPAMHDDDWPTRPTPLNDLSNALPQGPLTLARSLPKTATVVRASVEAIRDWLTSGTPAVPLGIQMRTVLVGSGRILLCLAPTDEDARKRNAVQVLWSECRSLLNALQVSTKFQTLSPVTAPQALVAQVDAQVRALRVEAGTPNPLGEAKMLAAMAEVVTELLSPDLEPDGARAHGEHIAWMFNRYSGLAHAFGWPTMTPPALLWADLGIVAGTAALAAQRLADAMELDD